MSEGPYRWQSRIRFVDTDASQRIHYTAIFRHFEAAEHDFLHSLGLPYTHAEFADVSFPRVHVECDFSAGIRYDDVLDVELTVERVGTSSFGLVFAASVSGKAAAKGRITVVCIDRHTQRPAAIPATLAGALRQYLG